MPKPTAQKSPSVRTLRRRFLSEQKPTIGAPLTPEELKKLRELTDAAAKSNLMLIEAGERVLHIRCALSGAEADYSTVRASNQKLHAEIAPLLHRLPTV